MNEFLNVQEVDKLPLNKMDRFVGVDQDGNIKTASVVVDSELDSESVNAIANNVVTETLQTYKQDLNDGLDDMKTNVTQSLQTYKRDLDNSLAELKDDVEKDMQDQTDQVAIYLENAMKVITEANDKLRLDVAEDMEEMQNTVDSAVEYLEETVGNIDNVLLDILG